MGDEFRVILSSDKMSVFWSELVGGTQNSIDHTLYYDADYVVLMGPVFSKNYIETWDSTIELLQKRGTKVVFMSAGSSRYDDEEFEAVSKILKKHRPYALLSRDSETYQRYNDYFEHSYDGICCALYCCDYAPKYDISAEPYIILNFDNGKEPSLVQEDNGVLSINGFNYNIKYNKKVFDKAVNKNLASGEKIIRTVHAVMPDEIPKTKKNGNYFISDMPYDYLNLYANASAVITNRVHAAVTSLAYGTPVYLANKTPRGRILNRIKCDEAYKRLITCDKDYLKQQKKKYEEAIERIFV